MNYYLLYVTCPDEEQAARWGACLVREKLAACVNLVPGLRSIYEWDGQLQDERECLLLAKTTAAALAAAQARLVALHSYECPCVTAIQLVDGHPPFLAWLACQTQAPAPPPVKNQS